ncbi:hypothetical protein [uncultured Sphingomonas sp.]|uniref:hypothetical protein n=1 Tax=uncultured Sphingomonas sp. TaxID=158754 RepID=UPI0035CB1704
MPSRVTGNTLAELDRLLHVLIRQVALDRGIRLPARSRNNSVGIAALCGEHRDQGRLRALLRSTVCLRRHDGRAHHADRRGRGSMTAGWSNEAGSNTRQRYAYDLGEDITPSVEQMDDVCAFYDRLARAVVGGRRGTHPVPQHGLVLPAA